MSRVVVVGGGLGGCAAAVRLAKLGHEVTLVERLPRVGGAVGFVEQDGYRWDAGPHATALPAVIRDLFRKSGRPLEREADLVPVEPMREHRFPDGSVLALPSGSRGAQLRAVDAALGPGSGRAWADHVHGFAGTWDALRRDWLEHPYVAGLTAEATERLLRTRLTMRRAVDRRFTDPRLRLLATHHAVAGGHDPRRVPAWMGMVDYLEQSFGTWTFPGGFGTLADLLAKRLRERRVFLRDPEAPIVAARLGDLFGLTRAESAVAAALGRGAAPDEIAADLGIGLATVRSHLKRILAKTGTHRQAEAAALLARSTGTGACE